MALRLHGGEGVRFKTQLGCSQGRTFRVNLNRPASGLLSFSKRPMPPSLFFVGGGNKIYSLISPSGYYLLVLLWNQTFCCPKKTEG